MPWSTISDAEVLNQFTAAEQAQLNNNQGTGGNLAAILAQVVNAARGAILAGGNQLDAAGSIPDQVRPDVIAIARWNWLKSFPQLKAMQTDNRRKAAESAQERLAAITTGQPKIEAPVSPIATTGSLVTMPSTGNPKLREFHRYNEEGI